MFKERVLATVHLIPQGKVMTYGQVAAAAGSPRAARQVGGILRTTADVERLPWWRVLNAAGKISIKGNAYATPLLQKQLLEAEGVAVSAEYAVSLHQYQHRPVKGFTGSS